MISQQLLTPVRVQYTILYIFRRHGCLRLWPDIYIWRYMILLFTFWKNNKSFFSEKIIMFAAVSFGWNYSLNGEYSPQCIFLTFGSDRKSVGRKVNHQHKFIPIGAKIWLDLMTFQMYSNALRHLIFVGLTLIWNATSTFL